MRTLSQVITVVLALLAILAVVGFATSWHWARSYEIEISENFTVTIESRLGRVTVRSHQSPNAAPVTLPSPPKADEKVLMDLKRLPTDLDAPVQAIHTDPPWRWLEFTYERTEFPVTWHGGGAVRELAIPYWFVVLLLGLWPVYRLSRRRAIQSKPS